MAKPYTKILNVRENNKCNCVLWVRQRVPSLPFGLWTLKDKKAIINSSKPKKGRVAIIETGEAPGHVALVIKKGLSHVTILEANYKACQITERHGTQTSLRIVGYFDPKKLDK